MAKAELNYKTKTKKVVRQVVDTQEVQKVSGVTLTLTKHEARVLHSVLRVIGGDPKTSLRGVTDRVKDTLVVAGVGYLAGADGYSTSLFQSGTCSLYFKDAEARVKDDSLDEEEAKSAPVVPPQSLQVGDKVRIVRKVASHTGGWENIWASSMDASVNNGKVYTISLINVRGVYFKEDGPNWYGWPEAALEKVPNLTLRIGAKIRITNPQMPLGYKKGDILTVRAINEFDGVYVSDARPPYDYPEHSLGAYVTSEEFEVIG